MPSLLDETDILGGRVKMYRLPSGSDIWQYRIWVKDAKRYIRKSTGTRHFSDARRIAEDAYYDVRAMLRKELPVISKSFKEIFELAMIDEQRKVVRGEIAQGRCDAFNRAATLYYLPFFKNYMVSSITQAVVNEYWVYREDFWKDIDAAKQKLIDDNKIRRFAVIPKGATLHKEKRVLDMVIDKAIELGYMSPLKKPKTSPPAKIQLNPRPALTLAQWNRMRDFMRDKYPYQKGSHINDEKRRARWLLFFYTQTLVASGIRISDARNLKWSDVSLITDSQGITSTLMYVEGKNKKRPVTVNENLFATLMEWRYHDLNGHVEDNDYVFSMSNGSQISDRSRTFISMMSAAEKTDAYKGVSKDTYGDDIVLYSLRHSYATLHLQYEGWSYEDLSRNMGNSAKMLEDFYDGVQTPDRAKILTQQPRNLVTLGNYDRTKNNGGDVITVRISDELVSGIFGSDNQGRQEKLKQLMAGEITKQQYSEWLNTPKSA